MVRDEYNHSRPVSALIRDWLLYNKAGGGGGILKTVTGSPISVSDALASKIKSLTVSLSPIQEGSGDPSPDNVRPITGRTAVTVTRTGKNLFPNPSGARSTVDLKAGVEYCFSANGASSAVAVSGKYADGTTFPTLFLNKLSGDIRYNSRVLEKDVSEIIIYLNGVTLYDCQIEVGSTPSAYAPYDGTSVTTQLGQTVYGGTVDAVAGKVHVTHELADMSALNWSPYADSNPYVGSAYCYLESTNYVLPEVDDPAIMSNVFKNFGRTGARDTLFAFGFVSVHPYIWLRIYDGEYHTRAEWQAKLAEMGAKVILPLAEPFDIDITPASLSTLRGDNTVWSDGDDVTMTYKAVSS